ncbi:uncharacterized protein LOC129121823 [Agelaius phoeniceus]|uniref:uncharacterized protein LOC129121823 n=1 Tax=Agelaius phoeniceus TaxID=39638 RepID=UPI004054C623
MWAGARPRHQGGSRQAPAAALEPRGMQEGPPQGRCCGGAVSPRGHPGGSPLWRGSGELRLVGGGGRCAGRVEVKHDGEWGSVCAFDFDWEARWAVVVCRQLGCGRVARASLHAPFGPGSGRIWLQPFFCRGTEDALEQCPNIGWGRHFCGHEWDVGVTCTDAVELRLAGGGSPCAGRVEVKLQGHWGTVGDDSWDMADAEVVCQQLGCGSASIAYYTHERFGVGDGLISLALVNCSGDEATLWNCEIRGWGPYNSSINVSDVGVVCQGFSRLVGGDGACAGRLEVRQGRAWVGVCEDEVDMKAAQVVCRELGCGEVNAIAGSGRFGAVSGSLWDGGFRCNGTEPLLSACARRPAQRQECSGPASVICSSYTGFRLGNGSSGCAGRVEVAVRGTWGSVCASEWDLPDAHVLCRHLGCGRAFSVPPGGSFGSGEGPLLPDAFGCSGSERHPGQCPVAVLGKPPCAPGNAAAVNCSGAVESLRLVKGETRCEGFLEYNTSTGAWHRVPGEVSLLRNLSNVCWKLDCGELEKSHGVPGEVYLMQDNKNWVILANVIKDIVQMTTALTNSTISDGYFGTDYAFMTTGPADIPHGTYIACSGSLQVRLVGSSGRCAGRVEVYSGGSWSWVCQEGWGLQAAAVVCRELGCGTALQAPGWARLGAGAGPLWPYSPDCSGSEESLWECGRTERRECGRGGGAGAVCSEQLSVRLAGGPGRCRGFLEMFQNSTWGHVCANGTSPNTASTVCRQLGCGQQVWLTAVSAQEPTEAWLAWVGCEEGASSLWQCPSAAWHLQSCRPGGDAHVECEEESDGTTEGHTTPYPEGASSTGVPRRRPPAVAVGSVPVPTVLCVVLGTLLCLSLGALALLLCRARARRRGPGRAADAISNAVYEELDYKAMPEFQEVPTPPGSLLEGWVKKLPYYTGDSVEGSDTEAAPDPPAWPEQGPPDGYDNVLDVPQEPPAASSGDISKGVARQRWSCVLPTGGIYSPPGPAGATREPSEQPPGHMDYDDDGRSPEGGQRLRAPRQQPAVAGQPGHGPGLRHVVLQEVPDVQAGLQGPEGVQFLQQGLAESVRAQPGRGGGRSRGEGVGACGEGGAEGAAVPVRPCLSRSLRCPARACRAWKGPGQGPDSPQAPQRAGGMPELLAELQDALGSQLVVTQVQAGETGPLQQPRSQGRAGGARQPAAAQPVGARETGKEGFGLCLLSCSGASRGAPDVSVESEISCPLWPGPQPASQPASALRVSPGRFLPCAAGGLQGPGAAGQARRGRGAVGGSAGVGRRVRSLARPEPPGGDRLLPALGEASAGPQPRQRRHVPAPPRGTARSWQLAAPARAGGCCHPPGGSEQPGGERPERGALSFAGARPRSGWLDALGSGELRLVGGGGRCAGRVEVKHDGEWGSVCAFDFDWEARWAVVVCRQLGCGRVARASLHAPFGPGSGRIWLQPFFCRGTEDALEQCPNIGWGRHFCGHEWDVGVTCTDAVELRLAGGGSPCAGRVEVKLQGHWGTVGDDSWDIEDAEVVCQQLGCGSASIAYYTHERFGVGDGLISLALVNCSGDEATLWDCEIRGWGPYNSSIHGLNAAVVCQGFSRLVGGDGACAGRLEVRQGRAWVGVCEDEVDMKAAQVVCRELGCGEVIAIAGSGRFGAVSGSLWDGGFRCNGTEPLLSACARRPAQRQECSGPASVICSSYTGFRLGNGSSGCAGRVEVAVRGTWGSVCASEWDLPDAHVLCRHLGCGRAFSVPPGGSFGSGEGPLLPDAFGCSGSERHPGQCPVAVLGKPPCAPGNAAAVNCSGAVESLRLVKGETRCEGFLEYNTSTGAWHRVPGEVSLLRNLSNVCWKLDCGELEKSHGVPGEVYLWQDNKNWGILETVIKDIVEMTTDLASRTISEDNFWDDYRLMTTGPADIPHGTYLVCSGSLQVRLVGSSGRCAGRVEVYSGGSWSWVCQEGWGLQAAAVVCRELGCGTALQAPGWARLGAGAGPLWPYSPDCSGSEESLWECGRTERRECGRGGGAGAVCSEQLSVRLAGGPGRCRGFLEISYNGTWGRVCANGTSPNTASTVCRLLGCGQRGWLTAVTAQEPTEAWLAWVGCEDGARSLWQCPSAAWHLQSCRPGGDAHVECEEDSDGTTEGHTTPYPEGASSTGVPRRRPPAVAVGSVPVPTVLCVVLGMLLCLSLGALAVLLCRARRRGPGRAADAISNAVYEELDYKAIPEYQEVPTPPGSLLEGWVKKLPYYTGDSMAGSDTEAAPDPPAWPEQGPPDGYDDVLDVPQEPPAASSVDISEGVAGQRWSCVLPTGGIYSPPGPPGASREPSEQPPGHMDYDDQPAVAGQPGHGPGLRHVVLQEVPDVQAGLQGPEGVQFLQQGLAESVRAQPGRGGGRSRGEGVGACGEGGAEGAAVPVRPCLSRSLRCPPRACRAWKGPGQGPDSPQAPQRAGGMPELLAELQDALGSQLVVTQVQAGETGPLQQPRSQGRAGGARQPAAAQPVGARETGKEGFGLCLLSCSGGPGRRGRRGGGAALSAAAQVSGGACGRWRGREPPGGDRLLPALGEASAGPQPRQRRHVPAPPRGTARSWQLAAPARAGGCCHPPGGSEQPGGERPERGALSFAGARPRSGCLDALGSAELRLVGGGGLCAGRVEVKHDGEWGSVCAFDFYWEALGAPLAVVVCRQLGCGRVARVSLHAPFGLGSGRIWLQPFFCRGTEDALEQCWHLGWGRHFCGHEWDVGVTCTDAVELRLAGGGSPCAGRVEVKLQGHWGSVADDKWDMEDAKVVCQQLGCGSASGAFFALDRFGVGVGPISLAAVDCRGDEAMLWDCKIRGWGPYNITIHDSDTAVVCQGFSRLVGGDGACAGRLEVRQGQAWVGVCEDEVDMKAAQVVCRELGCGEVNAIAGSGRFGAVSGSLWDGGFRCNGTEPLLSACARRPAQRQECSGPASVICSSYTGFRLGNGSSGCAGRVEVAVRGTWGSVCASEWDLPDAHVLCRHLGCGRAFSVPPGGSFGSGEGPLLPDAFGCSGSERHPGQCPVAVLGKPPCAPGNAAAVNCSGSGFVTSLRLVDGQSLCDGRLEETITSPAWRRVPLEQWNQWDAYMVCAVLGCGLPKDVYAALGTAPALSSSPSEEDIMSEEMGSSLGMGSALSSSPEEMDDQLEEMGNVSGMGPAANSSLEEMVIVCSGSLQVRLVGSSGRCAGRVEVYSGGSWSWVCQEGWGLQAAAVVCRELGCGTALQAPGWARLGAGAGPLWPYSPDCSGSEESLWECGRTERRECGRGGGAGAVCSEQLSVRLAGGPGRCRGFLEISYNGTWGRVCANGTSPSTASSVCRLLGCGQRGWLTAVSAQESTEAWLAWVGCEDGARSLWQCPSAAWHLQSCRPGGDAYVECEEDSDGTTEGHTTPYPEGASSTGVPRRRPPAVAVGSVPVPTVLCVVLGTLLCLSLGALALLLCRARAWRRGPGRAADAISNAVYEELDYKAIPEYQEVPTPPGSLLEGWVKKLPYYTGDSMAGSDTEAAPDPPAWPEQGPPDGYDDVLDVPQEPPAASSVDISEGVAGQRWSCVLPTGPPGATREPSEQPPGHMDYDDVGSSALGTLP